tara:strand:+ start:95 stop:556 length:462 start_codon:yes stop_codon:yes gene_type:complete
MNIAEFQTTHNLALPAEYVKLLNSPRILREFWFSEDGEPESATPWALRSFQALQESCRIHGAGEEPFFRILRLYALIEREQSLIDGIPGDEKEVISFSRLEKAFCIGEENGDYLYLDVEDDYSVWIYFHDGGDVTKVATSFVAWLNKTSPEPP